MRERKKGGEREREKERERERGRKEIYVMVKYLYYTQINRWRRYANDETKSERKIMFVK